MHDSRFTIQELIMPTINWTRFLIGGLIAAVICFLADGFLHERILAADWKAIYDGLRTTQPEHAATGLIYFAIFELGRGLVALFLYAMMRTHFGAGPKTAVLAGVVSWLAFSVTGPAQFIPLGLYSHALWLKVGIFQLVTSIVATIAGAALYKDV
jgi:hypothetical protein